MNDVHDPASPAPDDDLAASADTASSPEDAPKRRRARKTAVAAAAAVDVQPAAEPVAEPVAEAATDVASERAKPRRRRKVVTDEAAAAAEPTVASDAPPARPDATAEPAPAAAPTSEVPPAPPIVLADANATDSADAPPAQTSEEGPSAPASQDGAPTSRSKRRRDRNRRRDRDRGEGGDGTGNPVRATDDDGDEGGEARTEAEAAVDVVPGPVVEHVDVSTRFADVVTGQYDSEEPEDEAVLATGKRVLRPEPEAPKLHKVLAQSGIGSRRDMEQLILDGKVVVNGEVAHLGMRITHGDNIKIAGRPVKVRIAPAPARVLAYHKPVGEVVTHHDPEGRPTVFRRLPRLPNGKWLSVGRLDINTEGLLLFTNSGDLANQLMHPRFGVEREYAVRVLGQLDFESRDELLEGVLVDGQKAAFRSIEDGGGEGANHWYRVVINEGRNREVRKLFDEVGLTVSRLIRIRYGSLVLPRGLKRGTWVELDDQDVRAVRQAAGMGEPRDRGPQGQGQGPGRPGRNNNQQRGNKPRRDDRGPRDNRGNGPLPPQGPRLEPQRDAGFQDPGDPDFEDGPLNIPNPLEQTFDRRFATGSKRISAGFGRPSDHDPNQRGAAGPKGGPKQPDPMQTSVGYIGADAYFRKAGGGGGGGGGGGRRGRRGR